MSTPDKTIAEVAALTELSADTLRWYEREGIIPPVPRDAGGHRTYPEQLVRTIVLVCRLRATGMPLAKVRDFCDLMAQGAATHGRRMQLLIEHNARINTKIAQLKKDQKMVAVKIAHYQRLIEEGLDCNDKPITDGSIRDQQRRTT